MTTLAPRHPQDTTTAGPLCVAFALREKTWQLGCTTGPGQKPRERTVTARQQERVRDAIAQANRRVGRPATAPVVRGEEAGRAGVWRHRLWQGHGRTPPVVEASAIAGNRRRRRAQRAGVDGRQVLRLWRRYEQGARHGGQVVQGPAVDAEAQRPRHRAWETRTQERARTPPRLQGWLRRQGRRVTSRTTSARATRGVAAGGWGTAAAGPASSRAARGGPAPLAQ